MAFSVVGVYFMGVKQGRKEKHSQARCMSETCDGAKITVDTLCLRQLPNCVAHLVSNDGQRKSLHIL